MLPVFHNYSSHLTIRSIIYYYEYFVCLVFSKVTRFFPKTTWYMNVYLNVYYNFLSMQVIAKWQFTFVKCAWSKEFKRGNRVSLWPLCLRYGEAAILTVTYGGELLYLRNWRDHSARSVHVVVTAWFIAR